MHLWVLVNRSRLQRVLNRQQEDSDVEWKFSRSKLYMEFIKKNDELPVPFNMIPTPKMILTLFRKVREKAKATGRCKKKDAPPQLELNGAAPVNFANKPNGLNGRVRHVSCIMTAPQP